MASEKIKDLLLADSKHCSDQMIRSEQSGETRLSFFITLITFVAGAIAAGYGKAGPPLDTYFHHVAFASTIVLWIVGLAILLRMMIRNEHTDLAKAQLDLIRNTFRDNFDDTAALANYKLFPDLGGRGFGGLTRPCDGVERHFDNGVVIFAFLAFAGCIGWLAIVVALFAAFLAYKAQRCCVAKRKESYKLKLDRYFPKDWHRRKSTHAGGVVYARDKKSLLYLLVESTKHPPDPTKWVLPKGHIEAGEPPAATAMREVVEETGVVAKVVDTLGPVAFSPGKSGETTHVEFYLMEKIGNVVESEKREARWLPLEEAVALLSFPESREHVRHAATLIPAPI